MGERERDPRVRSSRAQREESPRFTGPGEWQKSLDHRASSERLAAPSLHAGLQKGGPGAPYAALLPGQRKSAIPGGYCGFQEPAGGCVSDGSGVTIREGWSRSSLASRGEFVFLL